jgi:hypothetical protein
VEIFTLCIGLASLGLMYWQVRIMMAAAPAVGPRDAERVRGLSYWPVIAMAVLAVIAWIPFIIHQFEVKPTVSVEAWGSLPDGCYEVLDGGKLQSFKSKYYVAMACGISNPTSDPLQDQAIAVSSGFTIGDNPITIEAKYTQPMMDTIKALASLNPPQATSMWRQAFLIPKNVPISRMKQVSDVRELGGKLIPASCDPIE